MTKSKKALHLTDKIFIAGANGMAGSAIKRAFEKYGYKNLLTPSRKYLNLKQESIVNDWFSLNKPDIVIIAAAKVGGILANSSQPTEFILDNLKIQNNIIEASWKNGVKKLLFLGSSCIYPKLSQQPIKEEYLLSGPLEPTNDSYAIAKIAGIKLCASLRSQYGFDAISLMPTNLYGPGDNYHYENSHVLPGLLRRFHEAKVNNKPEVLCWGTGKPLREFLYVDDLGEASIFILKNWTPENIIDNNNPLNILNVGTGIDLSIKELAEKIAITVNFKGKIKWDKSKPDGCPKKQLDITRINNLGWKANIQLDTGLKLAYEDFLINSKEGKLRS